METDQNPKSAEKKAVLPSSTSAYLDPHYWNERFSNEEHYEWLKDYTHFRHLVRAHVKPGSSVLELGCGNSHLSDELYNDGITDITCIDLSAVAIGKMQERLRLKGYKEIKVLEADMLDLPFSAECFDVVIEKGTMEVLFVNSGDPWNPRPETVTKVMAMLEGVHRVLKPDGIFISISFGQPHLRRPLFNAPKFTWSFEYSTFGDGFHYFFYILRKVSAETAQVLIVFCDIYESILTFYRERDHHIVKNLARNAKRR
ncbi:EEF1A lysine methyltransferase 4 isoform X1 [Pistacia vera]|uniref:EEF1A lysine methyltransferase 4 isoform X1 n=1 Tax=Pistacia vera TaxID=55513 RepID=UPI001263A720|nr:EEF1A lysine methyltransferase 4 isoform X1 [Pistacia vera]